MYPLGAKVQSSDGHTGVVAIVFSDGVWAKKFIDCPKCDRMTWVVDATEADFCEDSGPQYLIVDRAGIWRIIDAENLQPMIREPAVMQSGVIQGRRN